jgi:hypothetical protein
MGALAAAFLLPVRAALLCLAQFGIGTFARFALRPVGTLRTMGDSGLLRTLTCDVLTFPLVGTRLQLCTRLLCMLGSVMIALGTR